MPKLAADCKTYGDDFSKESSRLSFVFSFSSLSISFWIWAIYKNCLLYSNTSLAFKKADPPSKTINAKKDAPKVSTDEVVFEKKKIEISNVETNKDEKVETKLN